VNTIMASRGRSSETSLRLCSRAPRTTSRSATARSSLQSCQSWVLRSMRRVRHRYRATGILTRGSDIPSPSAGPPLHSAACPPVMPGPRPLPPSGRSWSQGTAPPLRRLSGRENIFEEEVRRFRSGHSCSYRLNLARGGPLPAAHGPPFLLLRDTRFAVIVAAAPAW
jgi:hypothetical protein